MTEQFSNSNTQMKNEITELNSVQVAKMLGVNVSTVKRWTEEGKLKCHKTAGGHRKFFMHHLVEFIKEHENKNPRVNLFPLETKRDLDISLAITQGDWSALIDYCTEFAVASRRDKVQQILNGLYLAQYPLYAIYDELITPVMHRLGLMWMKGELTIIEEHLATQVMRDSIIRLQGIVRIPKKKRFRALLVNLFDELHDIGLKMVDHVLEARGIEVMFSGQNTPSFRIDSVFKKYTPKRLYISSTFVPNVRATQSELDRLLEIAHEYGTDVYVGGAGFQDLNIDHPAVERLLENFKQVHDI
jgi:excisionase family DNA binding protein